VSESPTQDDQAREDGPVRLRLEGFAAAAVDEEASRLGVSIDELVSFSVLYYLADVDSGRIARRIVTSPYSDQPG
jgi:hypothetical protein